MVSKLQRDRTKRSGDKISRGNVVPPGLIGLSRTFNAYTIRSIRL